MKSWCDAKDTTGVWRIGRIKRKLKNLITVHFDGWSDKYKIVYCLHSNHIAPIRMHSKGYTGQEATALREWEYNEDNLWQHEQTMNELAESSFQKMTPYEATLYLRGDLFVLVDCLLSYTYTNPTRDIVRVENFFMNTLEFFGKWMKSVQNITPSQDKDGYLNSKPEAIYQAGYEIFEMIISILGLNDRTAKFFEKYKIFTSSLQHRKNFSENAFEQFCILVEKYSPDFSWNTLISILQIFNSLSAELKFKCLSNYVTTLASLLMKNPKILKDASENASFLIDYEDILNSVYDKVRVSEIMKLFIRKTELILEEPRLELIIESPNGSFIEHEDISVHLEEIISSKAPSVTPKQKYFDRKPEFQFPETLRQTFIENPYQFPTKQKKDKSLEYDALIKIIEEKHNACLDLINNTIFPQEREINNHLKDYLSGTADLQELQILNKLEHLITKRSAIEAGKLVRWRKKICKIAMLDGWEVADQVSIQTVSDLNISSDHLIQASLRAFLMKFDQ